jgi:ketosteroid isomerase-like protein
VVILILTVALVVQSARLLVGSETEDNLKAAVDALGNQAEKAFLAGDLDGLLDYYCDDVVSMPNFHPMIRGKADLKRMTQAVLAAGIEFKSLESTTLEAHRGGAFVYEVGTFKQAVLLPGTSEPSEQAGKYVTIWERQPGGKLKIAVEIFNSDTNPVGGAL